MTWIAPPVEPVVLEPLWTPADDAAYDRHRARVMRSANASMPLVTDARRRAFMAAAAFGFSGAGVWGLVRALADPRDKAVASTRSRDLICAETGAVFVGRAVPDGATFPLENPATHRCTLYAAEHCFWTPDGGVRRDPVRVLLRADQGLAGPTYCPDCGREVVHGNPLPPAELWLAAV